MLSRRTRILLVAGGIIAVVAAAEGGLRIRERHRTLQELRALRGELYQARVAADSCSNELAYAERLFQRYDTVVDSLRRDVRSYEADPGGHVPQARYDEYLERFAAYNDSVAAWHLKADSLTRRQGSCRRLAQAHNVLADSLRRRLAEEGISTDSSGS